MYRAASASGDSRTLISIRGDRQQIERRSGSPTLPAHTAELNSSHLSQERLPAEGLHGTGIHGDPLGEAGDLYASPLRQECFQSPTSMVLKDLQIAN
jgi:hypothetical protein